MESKSKTKEDLEFEEVKRKFLAHYRYGHPEFYRLILKMADIHEIKNKGYGDGNPLGNFLESERLGIAPWKGCLVRITDKYSRLCNLTKHYGLPEFADAVSLEGLEDTLIDLANYSVLCLVLLKESKKKEIADSQMDTVAYMPKEGQ